MVNFQMRLMPNVWQGMLAGNLPMPCSPSHCRFFEDMAKCKQANQNNASVGSIIGNWGRRGGGKSFFSP